MAMQTKNYSHKAHKCLGTNGYKIALQDMTVNDIIALHQHIETKMTEITLSRHAKEQIAERELDCTNATIEEMLTDIWNIVELQVQAGNKKALLLREDKADYALCACVGTNGYVVTAYGNELTQQHKNKNPKMYRKGGNVKELLK